MIKTKKTLREKTESTSRQRFPQSQLWENGYSFYNTQGENGIRVARIMLGHVLSTPQTQSEPHFQEIISRFLEGPQQ